MFRGIEGYGVSRLMHTSRILSLSDDLPAAIVIVDADEAIQRFMLVLDELILEGLVILDDVEVVRTSIRVRIVVMIARRTARSPRVVG